MMANSSQGNRTLDWTPKLLSLLRLNDDRENQERQRRRERNKERQRQIKSALIPLSSSRERALTLPLPAESPNPTLKQIIAEQLQSPFFTKLPPEIRMRIYIYVLGGDMISILKEDRLRYIRWMAQTRHLLPLLQTCRRVYTEAIDLMYSQNTFFFNDLDTICWFASTILPRRLDMIRSVYIEWDTICFWHPRIKPPPPYDRETWFEVWRILSSMKGLRELRVTIWNGPRMDSETEIEVFGPMRGVKGADVFELELPWEYMGEDETPHSDAPFRITRVKRKYDPEP